MKLRKSAKIKLDLTLSEVLPTLVGYTQAFNLASSVAFKDKDCNQTSLHKKVYYDLREKFGLPSQLACSVISKALEATKSSLTKTRHKKRGSCPVSKSCSIRYDARSFSLSLEKGVVSLRLLEGRKRIKLDIPAYYQELFKTWKHASADLVLYKKKPFLHIVFEKEIAAVPATGTVVGLDRGINNLAVTSNNLFFGGKVIRQHVRKCQTLRNKLQRKGTKSAKRHLVTLQGKERRFRADVNHQVSKQVIKSLSPGDTLVMEDLTGIRKGTKSQLRKKQRTLVNSWSFFQLEQFLVYKGMEKGIKVVYVDPKFTSQCCSNCSFIDKENRKGASFACKRCGFSLHADLNGSRNIAKKHHDGYMLSDGGLVNGPNGRALSGSANVSMVSESGEDNVLSLKRSPQEALPPALKSGTSPRL